jgi:hypothetical protein
MVNAMWIKADKKDWSTIITAPIKVTLVGTTTLLRPELEKTYIPIETTDLHTSADGRLIALRVQMKPKNFKENI